VSGAQVRVSVLADKATVEREEVVPWPEGLEELAATKAWCPGTFKGDHRLNENFTGEDVIGLDFDGGLSLAEFHTRAAAARLECVVLATKSHQKPKGTKDPADRFRVIVRLARRITTEAEHRATWSKLESVFSEVDPSTKAPAQFFYASPTPLFRISGEALAVVEHQAEEPEHPEPRLPVRVDDVTPEQTERARQQIEERIAALTTVGEGSRNDQLNRLSFSIGGLAAYLPEQDQDAVEARLEKIAKKLDQPAATARRAFREGMASPLPPEEPKREPVAAEKVPSSAAEQIRLISVADLFQIAEKTPPPLVPPLIPAGVYVLLAAPTGIGKSWLSLFVAVEAIRSGVKTAFGVVEDKPDDVAWRLRQMGADEAAQCLWFRPSVLVPGKDRPVPLRLDDDEIVTAVIAWLKETGIQFLILDPFRRLHRRNENSSTGKDGMDVVLANIDRIIVKTGVTVLVVHHTGASGERTRGSTAVEDDADVSLLASEKGTPRKGLRSMRIEVRKDKGIPNAEREYTFTVKTIGPPRKLGTKTICTLEAVVEATESTRDAVLADDILRIAWEHRNDGGVTKAELKRKRADGGCGARPTDVTRVVNAMIDAGKLIKGEGKNRWKCVQPPPVVPETDDAKPIRKKGGES
jgi:hypothetical protein